MSVHFVRKWRGSWEGNCPALYLLERPVRSVSPQKIEKAVQRGAAHRTMRLSPSTLLVVQGWQLTPEERAGLQNVAPDEDAVKVPADVVEGIRVPRISWDGITAEIVTSFRSVARRATRVSAEKLLIVQGWKIDDEVREQLQNVAPDEDAVVVPVDVIAGIKLVPGSPSPPAGANSNR